jgi:hypothetical protein
VNCGPKLKIKKKKKEEITASFFRDKNKKDKNSIKIGEIYSSIGGLFNFCTKDIVTYAIPDQRHM